MTARTDILVTARLDWNEVHLVAAFVAIASVLALLPAVAASSLDVIADLRG